MLNSSWEEFNAKPVVLLTIVEKLNVTIFWTSLRFNDAIISLEGTFFLTNCLRGDSSLPEVEDGSTTEPNKSDSESRNILLWKWLKIGEIEYSGNCQFGARMVLSGARICTLFLAWLAWKISARIAQFGARTVEAKKNCNVFWARFVPVKIK